MSTSVQEFVELLNAEQHVPVGKLRENARHGVPNRVRGEVWLYLLEVMTADRTSEASSVYSLIGTYGSISNELPNRMTSLLLKTALAHHTQRFFNPTYASLITSITAEQPANEKPVPGKPDGARGTGTSSTYLATQPGNTKPSPNLLADGRNAPPPMDLDDTSSQTLRSQYSRFMPPAPTSPPSRQSYLAILEEVLGKYWNAERDAGRDDEYRRFRTGVENSEKDWIWLVTPFVCCIVRPPAIFFGFQKLMARIRDFPPMPSRIASFLTLFRLAIPELFAYFEDEQVPYLQVAMSWVRTLFAKEMCLGNVLRLWDAYLAAEDMFELHCYTCVAVLLTCKEYVGNRTFSEYRSKNTRTLEELDSSEAKLMLLDLPALDIDRLLQDAANLKVTFALPRAVEDSELE